MNSSRQVFVPSASFPTVVRRRVVVLEPSPAQRSHTAAVDDGEGVESPPSSVFAPHYNEPDSALEELVDGLIDDDDDAPAAAPRSVTPPSARRIVRLTQRASVSSAAKQLGTSAAEVTAELVGRGLFGVTPRTVVTKTIDAVLEQTFRCKIVRVERR